MSANPKLTPSGSQTVGPYFRIGLQYLIDLDSAARRVPGAIQLRGRVIDRDGAPVPDALLEFWSGDRTRVGTKSESDWNGLPDGFHRVATDVEGNYSATITRPGPEPIGDGRRQAGHFLVLVFARGLLRNLLTRVYFENEPANDTDPVLLQVPAERRHTLIARVGQAESGIFLWNVVLQGKDETAFFAW